MSELKNFKKQYFSVFILLKRLIKYINTGREEKAGMDREKKL
jgi:hypothetical protein